MSAFNAQSIQWDADLIEKYNVQGPRYTSYPTAAQFHDISAAVASEHYHRQAASEAPLSLYVHIPFCRHLCYYCGCNKVAAKSRSRGDEYLAWLEREMALMSHNFGQRPITQLHLGGGTPTFLTVDQMRQLLDRLSIYFDWNPAHFPGEYSIELDPRETSADMLELLHQRGFNRLSFGIQDFNHQTQVAIHRIQPKSVVEPLVQQARHLAFESISFDLIYGLPYQTVNRFDATLDEVLELAPDRISLYNYAHLPDRFVAQRRISSDSLPAADEKLRILQHCIITLQKAGYVYIGMDHFAKRDDRLVSALADGSLQRNFQGYSTQAETDMLALGVSGISQVQGAFIQNHSQLDPFYAALKQGTLPVQRGYFLTRDDQMRRDIINQLACQGQIDLGAVAKRFGLDANQDFKREWQQLLELEQDGLVRLKQHHITVTALGRLLLRPILMVFDAYLSTDNRQRYSRVM
ncbi:oxygen-independent coproporphyrinogen III oxidase [Saccharospirillum impatiens]|uniref:oxygen-independent coproporphyrinogen III oxidase n=1 Tax=Saccharospirillum impatiens TaxID=169438 RepID=UPI00041A648F|nr:oxygen-independent coproporphyrinogen III oxidase [Saccharospirillum impatiens]